MAHIIKQLVTGSNWATHKQTVPTEFKRPTQAIAHLIDYATSIGAEMFYEEDAEHPGCFDVLIATKSGADTFTVEPVGFKLN